MEGAKRRRNTRTEDNRLFANESSSAQEENQILVAGHDQPGSQRANESIATGTIGKTARQVLKGAERGECVRPGEAGSKITGNHGDPVLRE